MNREACIQKIKEFSEGEIPHDGIPFSDLVDRLEDTLIRKALIQANWNATEASYLLRTSRLALLKKMLSLKIKRPDGLPLTRSKKVLSTQSTCESPR
jgi:DNA-binding NtrC family response regulator